MGVTLPPIEALPPAIRPLAAMPIWIAWGWQQVEGKKSRKRPKTHDGYFTDYTSPSNFDPYDTWRRSIGYKPHFGFDGVGISAHALEAAGADVLLVDVDDCRDPATGALTDWAVWVVGTCASYTEVSPSGTGLRIIGGARGWPTGEKQRDWCMGNAAPENGYKGETYFRSGWVTVTFEPLAGFEDCWNPSLGEIAATLERQRLDDGREQEGDGGISSGNSASRSGPNPYAPPEIVAETMDLLPNVGEKDWREWNKVGMTIYRASRGADEGLETWARWSAKHPIDSTEDTCEARWENYHSSPPTLLGYGSLHRRVEYAERAAGRVWHGGPLHQAYHGRGHVVGGMGPIPGASADVTSGADPTGGVMPAAGGVSRGSAGASTVVAVPVPALPSIAEEMIARRMVDEWGGELRFVAAWGKWMRWKPHGGGGGVWEADETLEALAIARSVCSTVAAPFAASLAVRIGSAKTINAVERLARADKRVTVTVGQWDQDIWSLNTPGGVLDLRSGTFRAADRGSHHTKMTSVAPDFEGKCHLWETFLRRVTGGDKELDAYLARMAGYCLTGDTSEHALFFFHGTGRNGKGTFLNTLSAILGVDQYAMHAGPETFTAGKNEHHLTELARLRGARMVVTTEVEEGRAWAEARIKQLTGGDPITANFMHHDLFTFMPQFKLAISGNSKPRIKAVNEAIRGRMNVVPFNVMIPEGERDRQLGDKLMEEGGAILAWAVRGCQEWQRIGLAPPAKVRAATAGYLADEDSRSVWLAEMCTDWRPPLKDGMTAPESPPQTRHGDLFFSWRMWADKAGEYIGNQRGLSEWLRQQGFEDKLNAIGQKVFENVSVFILPPIPTNEKTGGNVVSIRPNMEKPDSPVKK